MLAVIQPINICECLGNFFPKQLSYSQLRYPLKVLHVKKNSLVYESYFIFNLHSPAELDWW